MTKSCLRWTRASALLRLVESPYLGLALTESTVCSIEVPYTATIDLASKTSMPKRLGQADAFLLTGTDLKLTVASQNHGQIVFLMTAARTGVALELVYLDSRVDVYYRRATHGIKLLS